MRNVICLFLCVATLSTYAQFGRDNDCSPAIYSQPFALTGDIPVRATFRYQAAGSFCTGVLVNQQTDDQNLRQLFVTARHCVHEGDFGQGPLVNLNNVTFNFNFQSSDGNIQNVPANQPFMVGNRAINDNANNVTVSRYVFQSPVNLVSETDVLVLGFGVDIALLEILTPIPAHFNVAYAGWMPYVPPGPNGSWVAPFHLVHQPAGDVKKYGEAFQLAKFDNPLNLSCRIVTRTIDTIIRIFTGR